MWAMKEEAKEELKREQKMCGQGQMIQQEYWLSRDPAAYHRLTLFYLQLLNGELYFRSVNNHG